ncbi:MAG: hypothetical protein KGS49_02035, partial [Planctomycetes bacterium]|nr:hypothetical protein [Planctomycetota bacterium]
MDPLQSFNVLAEPTPFDGIEHDSGRCLIRLATVILRQPETHNLSLGFSAASFFCRLIFLPPHFFAASFFCRLIFLPPHFFAPSFFCPLIFLPPHF